MGEGDQSAYCLTIELLKGRGGVRKPAKELIRRYPQNADLYNLYALFEWANGSTEIAKSVLSSATRLGEPSSVTILPLWLTWAWTEFVDGAPLSRVLSRLCFSGDDGEGPSPTAVLRHKQELYSLSDKLLARGDLEGFSTTAKIIVLLEYLTSTGGSEPRSERQGSISSAMEAIWLHSGVAVAGDRRKSVQHEELLNFAAMLLYVHTTLG